jgi:multisubunit Na+/H+ antiporter MnhB subunit
LIILIILGEKYKSRSSHSLYREKIIFYILIVLLILSLVIVTTNFLAFRVWNPISTTMTSNIKKMKLPKFVLIQIVNKLYL